MSVSEIANGVRRDDLRLAGTPVITEKLTIRAAAIDDIRVGWIGSDVTALSRAGWMPVTESDGAIIAAADDIDAAAILLRAVNVVWEFVVHGYVVKLRGGLVVPAAPCMAAIHGDSGALVAAKDHSLRVAGIDPKSVIVIAAGSAFGGNKILSCISGTVNRYIGQVNGLRVFGIDIDLAEIPQSSANSRVRS